MARTRSPSPSVSVTERRSRQVGPSLRLASSSSDPELMIVEDLGRIANASERDVPVYPALSTSHLLMLRIDGSWVMQPVRSTVSDVALIHGARSLKDLTAREYIEF